LVELEKRGHRTEFYRSKSWDEFSGNDAVSMNIIVTVCDNAAGEVCPIWPGHPLTVHWPAPDPAHVEPLEARQQAFAEVYDLCPYRGFGWIPRGRLVRQNPFAIYCENYGIKKPPPERRFS
jgi:arsenate reductase